MPSLHPLCPSIGFSSWSSAILSLTSFADKFKDLATSSMSLSADKDIEEVARSLNLSAKEVRDRIAELHEENPMLGHRGCRLGISFPEIYEMQCRAIFEASNIALHCIS